MTGSRLLAPVDLRTDCYEWMTRAVAIASELACDLDLLYVASESGSGARTPVEWPGTPGHASGTPDVRRLVRIGDPADTIVQHAGFVDAGMILLPARRHGRWRRLWRRSITEAVLKQSSRPVWLAPGRLPHPGYEVRNRRVLCLAGLDGHDAELIWHANVIASRTESSLVLLHVVPELSEGLLHHAVEPSRRPLSTRVAWDALIRLAHCVDVPVSVRTMVGDAGRSTAQAAADLSADLVVIGRGRDGGLRQPRIGQLADRLHCPLLTIASTIPWRSVPQGGMGDSGTVENHPAWPAAPAS